MSDEGRSDEKSRDLKMRREAEEALQAERKGEEAPFQIAGQPLRCPHCGNTHFKRRSVLINTLKLDRLSESPTAFSCTNCGLIQWFAPPGSKARSS